MSFYDSLERIKQSVLPENTRGLRDRCINQIKDIQELLYHFYRLDGESRARYAQEQLKKQSKE